MRGLGKSRIRRRLRRQRERTGRRRRAPFGSRRLYHAPGLERVACDVRCPVGERLARAVAVELLRDELLHLEQPLAQIAPALGPQTLLRRQVGGQASALSARPAVPIARLPRRPLGLADLPGDDVVDEGPPSLLVRGLQELSQNRRAFLREAGEYRDEEEHMPAAR